MECEGYYCVHKRPPLVHIMSQMNSLHNIPPYFPKTYSNIIPLSSNLMFSNGKIYYLF